MKKFLPLIISLLLTLVLVFITDIVFFNNIFDLSNIQIAGMMGAGSVGIGIIFVVVLDLTIVLVSIPVLAILLRRFLFS